MSQQRRSTDIDLTYHEWHRIPNLSRTCYMYDVDALEVRSGARIVGVIEAKREGWTRTNSTDLQLDCVKLVAESVGAPPLLVEYRPSGPKEVVGEVYVYETIGEFVVTDLATSSRIVLPAKHFRSFIEKLPGSIAKLRELCVGARN